LNDIQEVVSSIPASSTNDSKGLEGFPSKPFFVEQVGAADYNQNEIWSFLLPPLICCKVGLSQKVFVAIW
jgi:hypothetical protein